MPDLTLGEIARVVGGRAVGPVDTVITGVASVRDAAPGDIVLAENAKYAAAAEKSQAAVVVVGDGVTLEKPVIVTSNPRKAFMEILELLAPKVKVPPAGVDPGSRVGERFVLGQGASVGFGCYVGDDVEIGEGAIIHPLVYLGDGVRVGSGSVIHPGVVVYWGCEIGSRVTIHGGSVIGADGFGYLQVGGEIRKIPQIGNVVIEDGAELGANVMIDRAKTGSTRIGAGTKIDNLVQVGHNCRTGRMCIIAGQTGLAGSSSLGDGVIVGGQAGIRDHAHVGDGVTVAGRSGVSKDVPAGMTISGYPALPHREALKVEVLTTRLPEMKRTIDQLGKEIEELKAQIARLTGGEDVGSNR